MKLNSQSIKVALEDFPKLYRFASVSWRLKNRFRRLLQPFSPGRIIRKNRIKKAKEQNRTFIANFNLIGCKMIIDPNIAFSWIYEAGDYERHIVKLMKDIIKPGMTCFDIGANAGYFSLLMGKLVKPTGKVFSFEPTAYTFKVLEQNIKLNGLNNIKAEQLALFDCDGFLNFHEGMDGMDVYNSAGMVTHPAAKDGNFVTRKVSCMKIDSYVKINQISNIDFIKLDVEGAEIFVLKGMINTMEANPNLVIVIEFADCTTEGFGYKAMDIGTWILDNGWRLGLVDKNGDIDLKVSRESLGEIRFNGQMLLAFKNPFRGLQIQQNGKYE